MGAGVNRSWTVRRICTGLTTSAIASRSIPVIAAAAVAGHLPGARLPTILVGMMLATRPVPVAPSRSCQWIEGDPRLAEDVDALKCGLPALPGASWCAVHAARCRQDRPSAGSETDAA